MEIIFQPQLKTMQSTGWKQQQPKQFTNAYVYSRDGRIVIFCRIPDSVNRRLISERDTEIRENPTRRATYNPAGGGFYRLVENRPDPDAGVGYPSIPSLFSTKAEQRNKAEDRTDRQRQTDTVVHKTNLQYYPKN